MPSILHRLHSSGPLKLRRPSCSSRHASPPPLSSHSFVVDVDASNDGAGAVLSQHSEKDNKLHPCAFLSQKLSPAERNYDVGNRELLAVKMALEEWRHWLDGAQNPFVWTDHKNLEYICKAKRLTSHQARWTRCFLIVLTLCSLIGWGPGTRSLMPCHICLTLSLLPRNLNPSYHRTVWWE